MGEQKIYGIRVQVAIGAYRDPQMRAHTIEMGLRQTMVHARKNNPGSTFGGPELVGWYFRKYIAYDPPIERDGETITGEFVEVPTADDASLASALFEVPVDA